jgi:anti-sigma B factor antagonist
MSDEIPVNISTTAHPSGAIILSPGGEIGYHEAPALQNALHQAFERRPRAVIIDLSRVHYMSTSGVAALVEALQISRRCGAPLFLMGLSDRVKAVFDITRLQSAFRIVQNVESALSG